MPRKRPSTSQEMLRRQFIQMWRYHSTDIRAFDFVRRVVSDPDSAAAASRWIEEYRARRETEESAELTRLARLRTELRGASLLLQRMCDHEGLSLAAVAYGILPRAHVLVPCEGFPWNVAGDAVASASVRRSYFARMGDRWESKFYSDGAFVRPRTHPSGRWAVRQHPGVLSTSMKIGGHVVQSGARGTASIDLRMPLPETVKLALEGRPLYRAVENPVFDDPAFEVRRVRDIRDGVRIVFACPTVPVAIASLHAEPQHAHQQLGRDGALTGDEAMRDVLRRGRLGHPFEDVALDSGIRKRVLEGIQRERIRSINLMTPPWAERLPVEW